MAKSKGSITIRTLKHYWRIIKRYKWMVAVNIIAPAIAVASGDIAFRYFLADLFAKLANYTNAPMGAIWKTLFIIFALVIIQVIFWRINDYTYLLRQAKTLRDMEQDLFKRLQVHSYRFFANNFSGSLTTQFNRYLKSYETLEDIFMFELLLSSFILVFSIIVLLVIAPVLGFALLIWSILFIGLISLLTIKKSPITKKASAADSKITANIADAITNILNIKVFARKQFESRRFGKTSYDRYEKRWRSYKFDAHIRSIRWVFVIVFLFVYLYLSIKLVTSGQASITTVLAAQFYIMIIYNNLFNLNRTIQRIELAFSDAAEMTEILDLGIEVEDPKKPENPRISKGKIKFDRVNFKYADGGNEVIRDFSLDIPAGRKVGLVGHSGSGKSTLSRLLLRFADLDSGRILIDEQDISKITQDDLRSNIAYVPQEPILFHRSLIENIRYGREDAAVAEVYKAARLAHAADFIKSLPEGYQTLVGERGIKLSGGEKQRVAIARAMLSRAPILILDEATSALDSKSEKLIVSALNELMKRRTTIVIAHRLSTIQKMDEIVVLDKGKFVERGNHKELLNKKGLYAELWKHQSGGFLED